jgi:hypothetical protein
LDNLLLMLQHIVLAGFHTAQKHNSHAAECNKTPLQPATFMQCTICCTTPVQHKPAERTITAITIPLKQQQANQKALLQPAILLRCTAYHAPSDHVPPSQIAPKLHAALPAPSLPQALSLHQPSLCISHSAADTVRHMPAACIITATNIPLKQQRTEH